MSRISPELALVDPELADVLRELLPDPGDCLSRPREFAPASSGVLELRSAPAPRRRQQGQPAAVPRRRRSCPRRLAWVAVAVILSSPLLAFISVTEYPRSGPGTVSTDARAQTSEPSVRVKRVTPQPSPPKVSRRPRDVGVSSKREIGSGRQPPERPSPRKRVIVRWPAVPSSSFYNLILVRRGQRLDFRPSGNVVTLVPETVAPSNRKSIIVYHWFVYPAFRTETRVRYGKLLADGTVRVPQGSIRLREQSRDVR